MVPNLYDPCHLVAWTDKMTNAKQMLRVMDTLGIDYAIRGKYAIAIVKFFMF